jgi:small-conductance mechanosensitive channel
MFVKWIPIQKIGPLISYEAFLVTFSLVLLAYLFYFFFLKRLSERRHGQLRSRFLVTTLFVTLSGLMASLYWILNWQEISDPLLNKSLSYLGLLTLFLGAIAVIKVAQIYVYLYLFFSNMTTGVPRLIANLFTFVFSIFLFGLIGSTVFNLNIITVGATSAVFSLVLGLALQDTLGNFFSGLALQIDRPFHINDWVEIQDGDQKWVGQIHEINWRATFLMSFSDELIMVPNKTIAQSKIIILGHNLRPVRLNHMFRFTYDTPIETAKRALLEGVSGFPEILTSPAPSTLVTEVSESWIVIKVYYSLHDYGTKFQTGDQVITKIMEILRKNHLKLAHTTIELRSDAIRSH